MRPRLLPYVLAFAVGAAAVALLAYRSYRVQRRVLDLAVATELQSLAALKATQVAAWRAERLGDLRVIAANSTLMPVVHDVLEGSASSAAHARVWAWLDAVRSNYRYGTVALVDAAGQVRLTSGEPFGTPRYFSDLAAEALAGAGEVFRDLGPGGEVTRAHFVLAAAVRSDGAARGAVVLAVDPRVQLFPVTLRWPAPSETGEVSLVRRDGDAALFLSDSRSQPGSAMRHREPLTETARPAVRALSGQRDIVRGEEANGDAALSAASPVAAAPWVVVTRIAEEEAYRPLRRDAGALAAIAAMLIVTLGVALAWLRRYQVSQFYRQQLEAETERRQLQESFDQDRRLLEEQLRQSQKLESIGRLAGGVAHDFNNLLTVMNGYSDLLVSRLTDEGTRELAAQVLKAGDRAASLTHQLLAFSRKQVTAPRLLGLNALIADSELMLSRLVGDDIEFVIETNATYDHVTADPGQLHQVLVNLVVNARDAMPDGGRLRVETLTVDGSEVHYGVTSPPARRYVALRVSDTGIGMDDATTAQIFEPFFTTKPVGRGTGLGLSTVYGIVQQNEGVIRVRSAVGQGTTFDIFIPCTESALQPEPSNKRKLSYQGTETVLVVEDRHDVRSFVVRSLRSCGYRVMQAATGDEALEASRDYAETIDLLVTDISMPGLNGRQLADRLRQERSGLRVLYISGYSNDVLDEGVLAGEGVEYLQKPFGFDELAAKVRATLQKDYWPRRVVVADAEPAIRALFQQLLTPLGYDVQLAADAEETAEMLGHGRVDILAMDLAMMEQEGVDKIVGLKTRMPGVTVIATSSAFCGRSREIASVLGADAVLGKPIDPGRLYEALQVIGVPSPTD